MTERPSPASIDQRLALATTSRRLAEEFGTFFGRETIDRFLNSSFEDLAAKAAVPHHLPVLVERFARQRLRALARVEGLEVDGLPTVLFLCVPNAGRSQMALGFFHHYAAGRAVGWSGGSEPGAQINASAVEAMAEKGIDISGEFPKPWTDEIVRAADVVITMGCGDACPLFPGKRYEEWTLADPALSGLDGARVIRDEIEQRVLALLAQLGIDTSASATIGVSDTAN